MKRFFMTTVAFVVSGAVTACGGAGNQQAQTTQPQPQAQVQPQPGYQEWVDLPVRILFSNGSSSLSYENQRLLDEAVELVRHRNDIAQVEVRGHTDSRGGDATNRDLSQQRAEAVKQFLVSRGVPPQIVVARGYSESAPLTSNTSASDRAQNRRVDFRALVNRQHPQGYQQGNGYNTAPNAPAPNRNHYNNGY